MREDVDRRRLELFLEELGRAFPRHARLYLSGGEGLVWRGLRTSTRDIDVAYEVDPAHHSDWTRAIVLLKERLNVNVEEAHPGDFVPLPPAAASRAESIGRFGSVEVYLTDAYSVALSKLDRGSARDLADVRALLEARVIDPARLEELTEAAIAADTRPRVRFDPARVRRNRAAVTRDAGGAASPGR